MNGDLLFIYYDTKNSLIFSDFFPIRNNIRGWTTRKTLLATLERFRVKNAIKY